MVINKFSQIEQSAQSGAFGQFNNLPLPTDKQIESGNYKKGKFNLYGLRISIEQPANSFRTGTDNDGSAWSCRLSANYGYILGTTGNDGDHIDCFIGSYPESETIYIINQFINGKFDEHKIMMCFPDEKIARSAYETSYSITYKPDYDLVTATVSQFKHWLKHGDKSTRLDKTQLPPESKQMNRINWDANGMPIGTDLAAILYNLRREDDGGLLLDAATPAEFNHDNAPFMVNEDFLDSLSTTYKGLRLTLKAIAKGMTKAGKDITVNFTNADPENGIEENPKLSEKPYKKYGVLMMSGFITLSDGQLVTIVFHNPDATPNKIQAGDTMIAWKWILNKTDITALAAPENGKDLDKMQVAKRIMNLAQKNSAAFLKANKNLADTIKKIDDLSSEIGSLGDTLKSKQSELSITQAEYDDWQVRQATAPAPTPMPVSTVSGDYTHTYNDEGVTIRVKRDEDGTGWDGEDGSSYDSSIDDEVVAIGGDTMTAGSRYEIVKPDSGNPATSEVTHEPTQPTQAIDPVTLANINASGISAAIKKKAIAYLSANPTSHSFEGSGLSKESQGLIMISIGLALSAEIESLGFVSGDDGNYTRNFNDGSSLVVSINSDKSKSTKWGVKFWEWDNQGTGGNLLLDSTQTLEDLKSWGFALPFDLDVKAFVANVIKPVVDEFLSKQVVEPVKEDPETQLRAMWTKQGVSKERQDEVIAELADKSKMTRDDFFPNGKALSDSLKAGDLSGALGSLKGLGKAGLIDTLLRAGFRLADTDTIKGIMAYVEPQILKAVKNKTDGYGLKSLVEPLTDTLADMVINELANSGWQAGSDKKIDSLEKGNAFFIRYQLTNTDNVNIHDKASGTVTESIELVGDAVDIANKINDAAKRINEVKKTMPEPTPTPEPQPPVVETPTSTKRVSYDSFYGDSGKGLDKESAEITAKKWNLAGKDGLTWDAEKYKDVYSGYKVVGYKIVGEPEAPTNSFDADIEALRGETDYTVFNDKLDELAGKLEDAGLMDEYDTQLNELADLLTELLKKAA